MFMAKRVVWTYFSFIHIFLDILIVYICKAYGLIVVIPLSPDSEQHQLSPNNIDTKSTEKVIRIKKKKITKGKWSDHLSNYLI